MRTRRAWIAVLAAASVLAACGGDDDGDPVSGDTTTTSTTTTSTTTSEPTSTSADDDTTSDEPAGGLPGERVETFPFAGAELAVVGVAHDDTLNVREGPGVDFDVVTELGPTALGFTATGHVRDLGDAFWTEVDVDHVTGWVNVRFVSHLGSTDDIRAEIESSGGLPTAGSVLELGLAIAAGQASDEPPSDIVVVVAPSTGDR